MTEPTSTRVVMAVAERKGVDPTALPSLHDAIDPDVLDALFAPDSNGIGGAAERELRFVYAGQGVRIHDGTITVADRH